MVASRFSSAKSTVSGAVGAGAGVGVGAGTGVGVGAGVGVGFGVGAGNGAEGDAQPLIARPMKIKRKSSEVNIFNLLLPYKEVISHIGS